MCVNESFIITTCDITMLWKLPTDLLYLPAMIPESVDGLFRREMLLIGNNVAGRQPTICEEGCLNAHGQAGESLDHYRMLAET